MRLPRVRVTVRMMMVAVAVAGVLLGAEMARRRVAEYRLMARVYKAEADYHARSGAISRKARRTWLESAKDSERKAREAEEAMLRAFFSERTAELRGDAERKAAPARYHDALRQKYERAAKRPWAYVPPDPPQPGGEPEVRGSSRFLAVPAQTEPRVP